MYVKECVECLILAGKRFQLRNEQKTEGRTCIRTVGEEVVEGLVDALFHIHIKRRKRTHLTLLLSQ